MDTVEATIEQQHQTQLYQDRAEDIAEIKGQSSNQENTKSPSGIIALVIFLPLAITADLLGALDLTGFGAIAVRIIDIPILGILWLWRTMTQGVKKDVTWQLMLTFLIEISPFGIIPTWTTFVLYCYFKDTKLGKKVVGKAERLSPQKLMKSK